MKQPAPLLVLALAVALPLAGCGKPDEAALAKGDAAFKGQMVDGQLQAVASRPVMVGQGGDNADACASLATPVAGTLTVRWSASADGPAKTVVEGTVARCETDGTWTGIVFPAFGQEIDECYVSNSVSSPREYQGPCRWGWVETSGLKDATAE